MELSELSSLKLVRIKPAVEKFAINIDGVQVGSYVTGEYMFPKFHVTLWYKFGASQKMVEIDGYGSTLLSAFQIAMIKATEENSQQRVGLDLLKMNMQRAGIDIE